MKMRRTCFCLHVTRTQIRCGNLSVPMGCVRGDWQVSAEVKSPKFNITSAWDLRCISARRRKMFVFAVACREVRNVSCLKAWLLVNPALAKTSIYSVKQGIERL